MRVLVDSSIWIDYFRGSGENDILDFLIDTNSVCTNYVILTELIPRLLYNKQKRIIELPENVTNIKLITNWNRIIHFQKTCIGNGINKVGIPDLMILDNVIGNNLTLYTKDKHFELIK